MPCRPAVSAGLFLGTGTFVCSPVSDSSGERSVRGRCTSPSLKRGSHGDEAGISYISVVNFDDECDGTDQWNCKRSPVALILVLFELPSHCVAEDGM